MAKIESFFWGIIAALGALILELIVFLCFSFFNFPETITSFTQLFLIPQFIIIGALLEEILKYLVISKRIEMLSVQRDYITNSFIVGFGFFSAELALISATGIVSQTNLLLEIATIHIGTAGIIGYIIATKNPKKVGTFLYAIFMTALFHGSYNLLILNRSLIQNYTIITLLVLLILINIVNFIRINSKLAQ